MSVKFMWALRADGEVGDQCEITSCHAEVLQYFRAIFGPQHVSNAYIVLCAF